VTSARTLVVDDEADINMLLIPPDPEAQPT
jgi:hypothetical protein